MAFDAEMQPADKDRLALQRARDRIAEGWCKRSAYDPVSHGVCMMGALICGLHDEQIPGKVDDDEQDDLDRLSMHLGFNSTGEVIRFNDWEYTSKDDVLRVFDNYLEGKPIAATKRITEMFMRVENRCQCPACHNGFKIANPGTNYVQMTLDMPKYKGYGIDPAKKNAKVEAIMMW